jgi:hypothetical protein
MMKHFIPSGAIITEIARRLPDVDHVFVLLGTKTAVFYACESEEEACRMVTAMFKRKLLAARYRLNDFRGNKKRP